MSSAETEVLTKMVQISNKLHVNLLPNLIGYGGEFMLPIGCCTFITINHSLQPQACHSLSQSQTTKTTAPNL